jgi:hypothetical protein
MKFYNDIAEYYHLIFEALNSFYSILKKEGSLLVTLRDYEKEDFSNTFRPYGHRKWNGTDYFLCQSWKVRERETEYDVSDDGNNCSTLAARSTYRILLISELIDLIKKTGFINIKRIDNQFYQPVIIAHKI